jgi:hypothetical protein
MLTDLDGYALLPNSYRVSGSHASEVRMFVLEPSLLLTDSSSTQVVYAPGNSDEVSPVQQDILVAPLWYWVREVHLETMKVISTLAQT